MYRKILVIVSFCISIFIVGCNQNIDNPVSSGKKQDKIQNALSKSQWFTSPLEYWTNGAWQDQYHGSYQSIKEDFAFSFSTIQTYNFSFHWGHGNGVVSAKVNDVSVGDFLLTSNFVEKQDYYTDWLSFTYNGKNMKVRFWMFCIQLYNNKTGHDDYLHEPRTVQVQIEEHLIDAPSGFTVSPSGHSNYNQVVSMSWNASSDNDVTGYEIYRQKWTVGASGYVAPSGFILVQTISSPSITSWQDSPLWTTTLRGGLRYDYEIRSVSSTLGKQSSFSSVQSSIESDYWNYLP